MKSNSKYLWMLLLFSFAKVQSQSRLDLMKYLHQEKKNHELLHFIQRSYIGTDSLSYLLSKYYLTTRQDSLFLHQINMDKTVFLRDTNAVGFASAYFLQSTQSNVYRKAWFAELGGIVHTKQVNDIATLYSIDKISANKFPINSFPQVLQADVKSYQCIAKKSPLKAACLSALVPGLGKIYIGKTRMGIQALLMNGMFAIQTYESIRKLGVSHPLSILNMLFTSFFYSSTIYGSYRDARYYKQEQLKQLHNNASNYYSAEYFPTIF